MSRLIQLFTSFLLINWIQCDNRDDMMAKAVTLGVTFYTQAELTTIAKCCEKQAYATPNNGSAIASAAKTCVINNSGSKVTKALSLYSNANSCLDPETIDSVVTKLTPPAMTLVTALATKAKKTLADCKSANKLTGDAKVNACVNQVYGVVKAAVTKAYVNTICTKLVKGSVSKQEWGCALKLAPQVMSISQYNCSKIVL